MRAGLDRARDRRRRRQADARRWTWRPDRAGSAEPRGVRARHHGARNARERAGESSGRGRVHALGIGARTSGEGAVGTHRAARARRPRHADRLRRCARPRVGRAGPGRRRSRTACCAVRPARSSRSSSNRPRCSSSLLDRMRAPCSRNVRADRDADTRRYPRLPGGRRTEPGRHLRARRDAERHLPLAGRVRRSRARRADVPVLQQDARATCSRIRARSSA